VHIDQLSTAVIEVAITVINATPNQRL